MKRACVRCCTISCPMRSASRKSTAPCTSPAGGKPETSSSGSRTPKIGIPKDQIGRVFQRFESRSRGSSIVAQASAFQLPKASLSFTAAISKSLRRKVGEHAWSFEFQSGPSPGHPAATETGWRAASAQHKTERDDKPGILIQRPDGRRRLASGARGRVPRAARRYVGAGG